MDDASSRFEGNRRFPPSCGQPPMSVAAALAAAGLGIGVLGSLAAWASAAPQCRRYRIRASADGLGPQKYVSITLNGALSAAMYAACAWLGGGWLYHDGPASPLRIIAETLAVLLLYDFLYYFLHRALHRPALMRAIHGVHHRVHSPEAMDGLYLHPAEMVAGLGLLFAAMAAIGPIAAPAFIAAALLHAVANIATHTNLVVPHPALALFNYWAVRHDFHHSTHRNANYASIFPFWDLMFGTYR